MSRHVASCNVLSRHVTSCHVMSRHVTSCHVMSRYVTSCHVTSCHVMSRHVTSRHVMTRHVTSYHVLPLMSCHATSCHVMSSYVTPYHVMSRPEMSRPAMSCHVMSRHVTSCHVMPRCVTSCYVTSCQVVSRHVTLVVPTGADSIPHQRYISSLFCISSTLLWLRPSPTIVPYRARKHRSLMSVMFALLLLSGNVESNPGPASSSFNLGAWNVRSTVNKTAPIHDTIVDFRLDALALSETWIREDDPPSIKCDPAPPGYNIVHVHRAMGPCDPRRGGGLAIVHRDSIEVRPHPLSDRLKPNSFELQLVRIHSSTTFMTVANIYRPPSTSPAMFREELSDVISDVLASSPDRMLMCGDFNDVDITDILDTFGLNQHVKAPTRSDNLLDLLISDNSVAVSDVRVDDAGCVSDHRLITARIGFGTASRPPIRRTVRNIKKIDIGQFEAALRSSSLFTNPADSADAFSEQMEDVITAELDRVAPLRTVVQRRPNPTARWLSPEAVAAKRKRRRLERR